MSRRGNCHDNAVAESFFNRMSPEAALMSVLDGLSGFPAPRQEFIKAVVGWMAADHVLENIGEIAGRRGRILPSASL